MNDRPPQVSLDTARLKEIGLYHLPDLATMHYDAAVALNKIYFGPGLFRSVGAESDTKSVAYETWCELFSVAQSIIGTTATIYTETAQAVVAAADDFSTQELSNAEQIAANDLLDIYENGAGHEPGFGPPPELPPTPPEPRDVPDGTTNVDKPDEGDFVHRS